MGILRDAFVVGEKYWEDPRLVLKFLDRDGQGVYSLYCWPLPPTPNIPGSWVEIPNANSLSPCKVGLHFPNFGSSWMWQDGATRLYVAQAAGRVLFCEDKICAQRGRLLFEIPNFDAKRKRWRLNANGDYMQTKIEKLVHAEMKRREEWLKDVL